MDAKLKIAKQYYEQQTIDVDAFKIRLQQRIKANRNPFWSGWKKKVGIAFAVPLILFAGTMAVGFTSSNMAERITTVPYIGKAFNFLNVFTNDAVKQAVNHGYSSKIEKESKSSGITLQIGNAYFDKNNLYFDVLESFDNGLHVKPVVSIDDKDITLNGTPLSEAQVGYGTDIRRLSNNQAGGSIIINAIKSLPETAAIQVHIPKIGSIAGNWKLSFVISREPTDYATKTYTPYSEAQAKAVNIDNGIGSKLFSYQINKIEIGPAQTNIEAVYSLPADLRTIPYLDVIVTDDENHTLGELYSGNLIKVEGGRQYRMLSGFVTSPDHAVRDLKFHAIFEQGSTGGFDTPQDWDLTAPLK